MHSRDATARRTACRMGMGGLAAALVGLRARPAGDEAFAVAGAGPMRAQQGAPQLRGAAAAAPEPAPYTSGAAACCALVGAAAAAARASQRSSGRTSRTAMAASAADSKSSAKGRPSGTSRSASSKTAPQLVTDVNPEDGPEGTYQVGIDFKNWLQSAEETLQVDNLRVEGTLPAWLRGSLVHAGPSKFEFGEDEFVDWVDGQAMLYRICIKENGVCEYTNKWLDTSNHKAHREAGRIAVRETCSRPSLENFWERIAYMFQPPDNENGNLHISQFAGNTRCISMSVGSALMEFTLDDLGTVGKVPFNDDMASMGPLIFHAEPHVDQETGEWFTCAIQLKISPEDMGLKPEYVVYSIMPDSSQKPGEPVNRRLITRIQSEYPSPVHTIGITSKYFVMIQIPYPLNWDGMLNAEGKWLMTGKYEGNLNDYNTWQPERPTLIRLVDKVTGEQLPVFETFPFFFFHIINCFEEKGESGNDCVFIDVICYEEPPVGFPLRQARSGDVEEWRGGGGEVKRFCLDLVTGEHTVEGWPDNCFDEPKINPKVSGQRQKYSYGVIDDNGMLRITKQDHETHEVIKWGKQDVTRELPWQPVFVPEPYNDKEDAGVLFSFVRDQPTGDSFCVVLDTETFEEHARIHFPKGHHIPLHGHGTWMQGQF